MKVRADLFGAEFQRCAAWIGAGETIYDVYADATQDAQLKARRASHPVHKGPSKKKLDAMLTPEALATIGRLVVESALGNLAQFATTRQSA
jgi:hypothetical protein